MPATKSKKTPAKKASANKKVAPSSQKKLPGKLARFFGNKKYVAVLVFVLAFAGIGSYRLYSTSAATAYKSVNKCRIDNVVVRSGSRGPCVKTVQSIVNSQRNSRDSTWPVLARDGIFGANTEKAVKKYQRLRGLSADGVVGSRTYSQLSHDCNYSQRTWGITIWGCN